MEEINKENLRKKKRYNIVMAIFLVLGAVGIVIGFCFLEGLEYIGFLFICIAIAVERKKHNFLKKVCNRCYKPLVGCAWEYQETSSKEVGNGSLEVMVAIRTKCPYCGNIQSYVKKFTILSAENLEYKVDDYMRKLYGDRL